MYKRDGEQLDPHSEGDGHDRCPVDGCADVDAFWSTPWAPSYLYHAPCGATWDRHSKQAVEFREEHRPHSHFAGRVTKAADTGRVISIPSRQFQDNYTRIFGHG